MKKIFSILCAILLLHSSCAIPIETEVDTRFLDFNSVINFVWGEISAITDGALSIFSNVMQNIQTLLSSTLNGINTLTNDTIQNGTQTAKIAIDAFTKAAGLAGSIGPKIFDALNNANPNTGAAALSDLFNNFMNAIGTAINATAAVDPAAAAAAQKVLAALMSSKAAILGNLTAAAKAGTSGMFQFFPKPLAKVLGDPTLKSITDAVKSSGSLLNDATTAMVAALTKNPFTSFVNDVLIAPTKNALNAALGGVKAAVTKLIGTAASAVNDKISTILNTVNQLVPEAIGSIDYFMSLINSTLANAVKQANSLPAANRTAVQQQIQALADGLTQLTNGLKANLTQILQGTTGQIKSDIKDSVANITGLAQTIAQQVVNALTTSKDQAKDIGVSTLSNLIKLAQGGLSALTDMTSTAVGNLQKNVGALLTTLHGSSAVLEQNILTCFNTTSGTTNNGCLNVRLHTLLNHGQI